QIHETVRRMINRQVNDLIDTSLQAIQQSGVTDIDDVRRHMRPLIQFSSELQAANQELKRFLRTKLYKHYRVYRMTVKSQQVIKDIFSAYEHDPLLLPED